MKNKRLTAIPALLFISTLLYLFAPVFLGSETLFSVDGPPSYSAYQTATSSLKNNIGLWRQDITGLGQGFGGRTFHPLQFAYAWSYHAHGARYLFSCIVIFLGLAYYLRGLGIRKEAALTAALAFTFTGYSFTLISAGHHGFFTSTAYMVWTLGFIHRAVTRGSLWHFAAVGAFMIYGMSAQPDFMGPCYLLYAAYALLLFVSQQRNKSESTPPLKKIFSGAALTLLIFALLGLGSFKFLFETVVPGRELQRGNTPQEKWIFATNWSFPPSEMLEFIAPNVFGVENITQDKPYWGKIGRSYRWEETHQGFKNFRQHSVYLGVLQIIFALLAFHIALRNPKSMTPLLRRHIFFWSSIALLTLFLSFGRHFFVYRIWYALPFMDYLRAPIKFLRLVELSTCVLMGIGLHLFITHLFSLKEPSKKQNPATLNASLLSSHAIACFAMIAILLMVMLNFTANPDRFSEIWRLQGLSKQAQPLTRLMVSALANALVLFLFGGSLLFATKRFAQKPWFLNLVLIGIPLCIAIDSGRLCATYINTRDLSAMYAENPIAEKILTNNPHVRMKDYLTPRRRIHPLSFNWKANGSTLLGPSADAPITEPHLSFFNALQRNPIRLQQITSTPYAIGQAKQFAQLPKTSYSIVTPFTIKDNRYRIALKGAPYQLIKFKDLLPRAAVYHTWTQDPASSTEAATLLANPATPLKRLLIDPQYAPPAPPSQNNETSKVKTIHLAQTQMSYSTTIKQPGILMTTDSWHPDTKVTIDGNPAELMKCNGLFRGVYLEPGEHNITFTYRPYLLPFIVNISITILLSLTALLSFFRKKSKT